MNIDLNKEIVDDEDNTEYVDYVAVFDQLVYLREISRKLVHVLGYSADDDGELKLQKN